MSNIVYVTEAKSTNSLMASIPNLEHGSVIATFHQTAGRGQRGNSWESEPGKNLTFSLMLRPRYIAAACQFELSEIVALSIAEVLSRRLGTNEIRIKWPNDIYYRDSKICGILIENTLCERSIDHSIVGVGINVNQQVFLSDAPNPISMSNISGAEYELRPLLEEFADNIVQRFDSYEQSPNPQRLSAVYRERLWRGEGFWPYRDTATGEEFDARVACIAPTGHLTLIPRDGRPRTYAFKEVAALL